MKCHEIAHFPDTPIHPHFVGTYWTATDTHQLLWSSQCEWAWREVRNFLQAVAKKMIMIVIVILYLSFLLVHLLTRPHGCTFLSYRTDVWCSSLYTYPSHSRPIFTDSAEQQCLLLGLAHQGYKLLKIGMEAWNCGTLTAVCLFCTSQILILEQSWAHK